MDDKKTERSRKARERYAADSEYRAKRLSAGRAWAAKYPERVKVLNAAWHADPENRARKNAKRRERYAAEAEAQEQARVERERAQEREHFARLFEKQEASKRTPDFL